MPRVRVILQPDDGEPLPFYTGDLEPGEIGSIIVAAMKLLAGERGWRLTLERIPDELQPGP